jgi:hypothetical protein
MSKEDAGEWRDAINRRLEVLGVEIGQAVDPLSSTVDTRWFMRFMNGTTDLISKRDKQEIVLALGPNWKARGQRYTVESLQYFEEDEDLLNILSIDPKLSED